MIRMRISDYKFTLAMTMLSLPHRYPEQTVSQLLRYIGKYLNIHTATPKHTIFMAGTQYMTYQS